MTCRLLPLVLVACAAGPDAPPDVAVEVRLATWNVQRLGSAGSDELVAAERVLARLDADVVVLQEVGDDEGEALAQLADGLGYAVVAAPPRVPWGDVGTAALARLEGVTVAFPDAAALSGDPDADDLTRLSAVVTIPLPEAGWTVSLTGAHLKSGWEPADAFRRAVDALRTAQAAREGDVVLVAGDLNDDVADVDPAAAPFRAPPPGVPAGWTLGRDLRDRLAEGGIPRDPFAALAEAGLAPLAAPQRDRSPVTRPESGRRLDYVLGGATVEGASWRGETYDPADEARPGIADGGSPLDAGAVRAASDHLPVLGVLALPARR